MAAVVGNALTEEQNIGADVAILGVLLWYGIIDDLLKKSDTRKNTAQTGQGAIVVMLRQFVYPKSAS